MKDGPYRPPGTMHHESYMAAPGLAAHEPLAWRHPERTLWLRYHPQLPLISTDRPLVLLPVRLETRFFGEELRVRIYPDKVHVDTHEPELTDEEVTWGNHFRTAWTQALSITDATQREEQQKAAWHQLAERFGATRAAWIKRQLDAQQAPLTATGRTESWTRAPYTRTLPDYWIALVYGMVRYLRRQRAGQAHCGPTTCRPKPAGSGAAGRRSAAPRRGDAMDGRF